MSDGLTHYVQNIFSRSFLNEPNTGMDPSFLPPNTKRGEGKKSERRWSKKVGK